MIITSFNFFRSFIRSITQLTIKSIYSQIGRFACPSVRRTKSTVTVSKAASAPLHPTFGELSRLGAALTTASVPQGPFPESGAADLPILQAKTSRLRELNVTFCVATGPFETVGGSHSWPALFPPGSRGPGHSNVEVPVITGIYLVLLMASSEFILFATE